MISRIKLYLKRMISLTEALLSPWTRIRKLTFSLKIAKQEIFLLSEKIQILKNDNMTSSVNHIEFGKIAIDEIAGMLNWPELLVDTKRTNGFNELTRLLSLFSHTKNPLNHSSNCWTLLATKNCDQLLEHGYSHFKRTIGHNYFNFLVQKGDSQIKAAESLFPDHVTQSCQKAAMSMPNDPAFNGKEQFSYHYFIFLLWEYVKKIDTEHYLKILEEPKEGNPIVVSAQGKTMSQDLANSLIEYYSIKEVVRFERVKTVLEIGGGYGRNAHVMLSLNPHIKIVLVDILPALYIAQRYLSSVFKDYRIFKARNFSNYQEVKELIESASIVFLLPHQLELLPDNYFNLCVNISSFGEMKVEQIEWYFSQINRLTSQYFYTKQWFASQNPFDDLVLKQNNYPYPINWKELYSRQCSIQTDFFETLFQVNSTHDI